MLQQQQFFTEYARHFANSDRGSPTAADRGQAQGVRSAAESGEAANRGDVHQRVSPATVNSDRLSDGFVSAGLATQIPEFGGTEAENVNTWIRRVDINSMVRRL